MLRVELRVVHLLLLGDLYLHVVLRVRGAVGEK